MQDRLSPGSVTQYQGGTPSKPEFVLRFFLMRKFPDARAWIAKVHAQAWASVGMPYGLYAVEFTVGFLCH